MGGRAVGRQSRNRPGLVVIVMHVIDPIPMLWAGFMLLDKVTAGSDCKEAIAEVQAHLSLNHSQVQLLQRAFDVLCGEDHFKEPAPKHPGAHWG
jgi:hypothetical protein